MRNSHSAIECAYEYGISWQKKSINRVMFVITKHIIFHPHRMFGVRVEIAERGFSCAFGANMPCHRYDNQKKKLYMRNECEI